MLTNPPHSQKNVIPHEIARQTLNIGRERSTKHHSLPIFPMGHILLLHNPPNLGLKSHIKHTISLVQNQEFDIFHPKTSPLDEIDETTGRGNQQIAAAFNLPELIPDIGSTVNNDGCDSGAVEKLLRFILDLARQLASGSQHQALRVGPSTPDATRGLGAAVAKHGDDDGEEESCGLATAGLSAGHQITIGRGDGDAPLLHRRGLGVAAELHVAEEVFADGLGGVDLDGVGHVGARGLHRDVVVVVEVDAGGLLDVALEQLALEPLVGPHVAVVASLVAAGPSIAVAAATTVAATVLHAAPTGAAAAAVIAAPATVASALGAAVVSSATSIAVSSSAGRAARGGAVAGSATGLISQVRRNYSFISRRCLLVKIIQNRDSLENPDTSTGSTANHLLRSNDHNLTVFATCD